MDRSSLERLLGVQEYDEKVRGLSQVLGNLEVSSGASAANQELAALRNKSRELDAKIKMAQARRDELEERSRSLLLKSKSMRAKEVSGAISHRDLGAAELEIEHLDQQRSQLEDEELELLGELDFLEEEAGKLKAASDAKRLEAHQISESNSAKVSELDSELDALASERALAASMVDSALLGIYESIRSRVGSMTLATIVNSSCEGCRLKLSAVEIANVRKTLAGEFANPPTCEQCGRLLLI